MNNKNLIITILISALVAGGAFYGGIKYQQSQRGQQNRNFQNMPRNNFRPVNGEIIAVDDKSITVKMPDGSSKIVILSAKTVINKATTAPISELKSGAKVMVTGTTNTDGSVTAENIRLSSE